jgi:hypothetical protein
MAPWPPLSRSLRRTVQRSPPMGNGDLTVCMVPPISGRDVYGMGRPSGGVCMTGATEGDIEAIVNRGRTPIAAIATSCCSGNCSEPRHIGDEARNDRSPNRLATRRFSHRLRRQSWRAEPPVWTLRSDKELTLRADSARSLATDVRPLPGAFLPFRQRSLSAQLRHAQRDTECPLDVDTRHRPMSQMREKAVFGCSTPISADLARPSHTLSC